MYTSTRTYARTRPTLLTTRVTAVSVALWMGIHSFRNQSNRRVPPLPEIYYEHTYHETVCSDSLVVAIDVLCGLRV